MRKQILILTLCIFLISLVTATTSLGTIKQTECIEIPQVCASCSYVNVSVQYPNKTIAVSNQEMASRGAGLWTYEFCNTSQLGRYDVSGMGDINGVDTGFSILSFDVTYLGKQLDSGKAIMYLGFLSLLVLIFILNFVAMAFLPKKNQTDEEGRILSITYLKYFRNVLMMTGYFLFIGITFIASNLAFAFLEEELLAQTLYVIYRISFGLAPLVVFVWLIWTFVSMFHDKQFQKMINRGMFPQGRI
jgi:hypothetical protein